MKVACTNKWQHGGCTKGSDTITIILISCICNELGRLCGLMGGDGRREWEGFIRLDEMIR